MGKEFKAFKVVAQIFGRYFSDGAAPAIGRHIHVPYGLQNIFQTFMRRLFLCFFCITLSFSCNAYSAEKLTVLLDWFANPSHAPLFVAEAQGFFREQNLDVNLIGPADPSDPPKLVAAGKADIAITYEPQLVEQVARGLPLLRIGTLIDTPLNCLAVLESSSIKSIKDLRGKRVGYSMGGVTSVALATMLKKK